MVQFGTRGIGRLTDAFSEGGWSGAISEFGDILGEAITKGLTMLADALPSVADAAVSLVSTLVSGIETNADLIGSAVVSTVFTLCNGILSMLPTVLRAALALVLALAEGLSQNIGPLVTSVVSVALELVGILTTPEVLSGVIDAALTLVFAAVRSIIGALPLIIGALPTLIENILTFAARSAPVLVAELLPLVAEIVFAVCKAVVQLLLTTPDILVALFTGLFEGWKQALALMSGQMAGPLTNVWNDIVSGVREFFAPVIQIATGI